MINLLPPRVKHELRQEETFRLLAVLGLSVLVALVCCALLLLTVRIYLGGEVAAGELRVASERMLFSEKNTLVQEMKEFNGMLVSVSGFLRQKKRVSPVLEEFASILPASLYLTSLNYTPPSKVEKNKETQAVLAQIAVTGFAPKRDALLGFRDVLQRNPLFTKLTFPPSNWVNQADITFSFQAAIQQ